MKICLVNPNWSFDGSIYFGCRAAHLPLEFGYTAQMLKDAGHEAKIIDGQLNDLSLDEIRQQVKEFNPDATVVTTAPSYLFWRCAPPELRCPQEVIQKIRDCAGRLILTGPHASTTPKAAIDKTGADVVILGECEEVITELASKDLADIESIGYYRDGKFVCDGHRHSSSMEKLPALKWSAEDLRRHKHHHHRFDIEADGWGAEMETSRGCPYSCSFCAKDNFRNRYRKRSLETILEELDGLIAAGATYVYFIDEIFLPNRELLDALVKRNINFGVQTRIDLWDFDMLELLGRAGCVSIEAGVESITPEGRAELNKKCKMTTADMSARLVHARKFVPFVQGNLIDAGTDEMEQVGEWRSELLKNGVWANEPVPLFPYPGSPDYIKKWGIPDDSAWERAHEHYLSLHTKFSDVQEDKPLRLNELELRAPVRERRKSPGVQRLSQFKSQDRLRILMTCDTVGGVWTYAMGLCAALEGHGAQILLAVMGPKMSRDQQRESNMLKHVQIQEHEGKLEWMEDPWADVDESGRWLLSLANTFRPNVVHLNGFSHANLPWKCPVITVAHSCVFSWWNSVKGEDPPAEYDEYRDRVQAGLRSSDMVVAPTEAILKCVKRLYGPFRESTVIHNGNRQDKRETVARSTLIFSAGRLWDEAKDFQLLDRLARELPWPVAVAGCSQLEDYNMDFQNLKLLGRLTPAQMAEAYQKASIFVSPSLYEPFGLCVLEAASWGCPLVLSDIESFRELWGDDALYFSPGSQSEFSDVINYLINDAKAREEYGERAQKHARLYSSEICAGKYAAVYESLARRDSQARFRPGDRDLRDRNRESFAGVVTAGHSERDGFA